MKILRRVKTIPAVPLKLRLESRHLRTPASPIPVTGAPGSIWRKSSILQLGSDGSYGCTLLPFTNRQFSEKVRFRTVFVTAFEILTTLYHVFKQKSNVFITKISKNSQTISCIFPKEKNILFRELTNVFVCALMTSVHKTKTLTENLLLPRSSREPAVGASRCGGLKRSDSRVGSVNSSSLVMEPGCHRYQDRTCWSLKRSPL